MSFHFDAVVIGVGAMGAATCCELAHRGVRVLGLEKFGIAHDRGSSHGLSRMIRLAYYEHPDYVPLLRRAYERWIELEQLSGRSDILHITGGLFMCPRGGDVVESIVKSARAHALPYELLDSAEIRRRYPQFAIPDDFIGLFEPATGLLAPERAITAFARIAMQRGAEIHGHEPVREWSNDAKGVTVRTDAATYHADRLVVCGGPWSASLLRDLGIDLTVTRQLLGWVWPREPERFKLGAIPCWAVGRPDGSLYYGFPMSADDPGLKCARHAPGPVTDADRVSREPTREDDAAVQSIVREWLPSASGPTVSLRICLYTNSPDSHFIMGRHPRYDRVTLACGFSGHGFKFASVVGEILADLALRGTTDLPAAFLSPSRFGRQ
jgi:sarcosine oxidase